LQLHSPVTQELELARSDRGPVEEVEEEEQGFLVEELADARALAWRRPNDRIERCGVADLEHVPSLRSRRLGLRFLGHLGRVRDLPHDLDDVPVRVEDVELSVGAVATAEDLLDPG
jgi:hypothetical protein